MRLEPPVECQIHLDGANIGIIEVLRQPLRLDEYVC
jgi:hypothetical protein